LVGWSSVGWLVIRYHWSLIGWLVGLAHRLVGLLSVGGRPVIGQATVFAVATVRHSANGQSRVWGPMRYCPIACASSIRATVISALAVFGCMTVLSAG
jgi:hypothetical protein